VQILEHEQHWRGGRPAGEQRQRVLEDAELRARLLFVDLTRLPDRTQGLDERLIRQIRTDKINRLPDEDLEPRVAGTPRDLGHEPGLPDARFPGDEDGRTAARPGRVERALEFPELACASDERRARASLHSTSIALPPTAGKALPGLHIAEVVADQAARDGRTRAGVIGTRYTMDGPLYPRAPGARGIATEIPAEDDRLLINEIIFDELVNGVFTEQSRREHVRIIENLAARGCDAVALVCTETPILVPPEASPLPRWTRPASWRTPRSASPSKTAPCQPGEADRPGMSHSGDTVGP